MAVLTWRNVEAPDFSSAMRGQELAARHFQNAVSQIGTGIEAYDGAKTEEANRAFMLDMIRVQDAEAAKRKLADPNFGANRRISKESLEFAAGRPGALTEQATRELALKRGNWQFGADQVIHGQTVRKNDQDFNHAESAEVRAGEDHVWKGETHTSDMKTAEVGRKVAIDGNRRAGEAHGWNRITFNNGQADRRTATARNDEADKIAGQLLLAGSPEKALLLAQNLYSSGQVDAEAITLAMSKAGFKPLSGDGVSVGGSGDPLIAAGRDQKTTVHQATLDALKNDPTLSKKQYGNLILEIQTAAKNGKDGRPITAAAAAALLARHLQPKPWYIGSGNYGMHWMTGKSVVGDDTVVDKKGLADDIKLYRLGSIGGPLPENKAPELIRRAVDD